MFRIALILLLSLFWGCGSASVGDDRPRVTVSIAPLGYLVEQLADSLVGVDVLVPLTTSPESYDPTAMQLRGLSSSDIYFSVGLIDFEASLASRILDIAPDVRYVDLSDGVDVMAGSCSHSHGDHSHGDHSDHHGHSHGVDPHIWLSPLNMIRMAEVVCSELTLAYPDYSQQFTDNLALLRDSILAFDLRMRESVRSLEHHSFAIVHPSLSYFARDYGLEQLPVEFEGKEPSARHIASLVDQMREHGIRQIFYARQDSDAAARTIASELQLDMVEYDPLRGDWLDNMYHIKDLLCD